MKEGKKEEIHNFRSTDEPNSWTLKDYCFYLDSIFNPFEGAIKITEGLGEYEVPLSNDLYSVREVGSSAACPFLYPPPSLCLCIFISITCCDHNTSSLLRTKLGVKSPRP